MKRGRSIKFKFQLHEPTPVQIEKAYVDVTINNAKHTEIPLIKNGTSWKATVLSTTFSKGEMSYRMVVQDQHHFKYELTAYQTKVVD